MNLKTTIKQKILFIVLVLAWIAYYFQSFKLFSEVKDFITPGGSYIIQILEFTNYRAEPLSFLLIEYFILISVNSVLYLYIYKTIEYTNKRRLLSIIIIINIIFIAILCVISNLFWSVYLLLTLLSLLIIAASVFVSGLIWSSTTEFEDGDVIYRSQEFSSEENAKDQLNSQIKKLEKEDRNKVSGEIFEDDKKYYFEIYANDRLILENKGEFNFHEEE